jgi:hypothetical protein
MHRELLGHLWSALDADPALTPEEALDRLGDANELTVGLQRSVPRFERFIYRWFLPEETSMLRLPAPGWIVATVVFLIGWAVAIPDHAPVMLGALGMLAAVGVLRLLQSDRPAIRRSRRQLPWFAGLFLLFFGPAIILPALAALRMGAGPGRWVGPCILGALLMFGGIVLLVRAAVGRKTQPV